MIILPETLKALRKRHGLSQADLSEVKNGRGSVSTSTIKRIESAKGGYEANPRVAKKLAKALKVQPEDLAKEFRPQEDTEKQLRDVGYRTLKAVVDGETELAFQMVELLYGIPKQSQILMAPLFSALLAEGSLAARREQLGEIEAAAKTLNSMAKGHLMFAGDVAGVTDGADEERQSIKSRDIFGRNMVNEWPNSLFDPDKQNPFADYLQAYCDKTGAENIVFDPDEFGEWKTREGLPEYRIAPDFIKKLTGGDFWAEFALRRGHATILDIPKELRGPEVIEERVNWLAAKVPAKVRERQEKIHAAVDLQGIFGETPNPTDKEE